jgi:hypothetical protein
MAVLTGDSSFRIDAFTVFQFSGFNPDPIWILLIMACGADIWRYKHLGFDGFVMRRPGILQVSPFGIRISGGMGYIIVVKGRGVYKVIQGVAKVAEDSPFCPSSCFRIRTPMIIGFNGLPGYHIA